MCGPGALSRLPLRGLTGSDRMEWGGGARRRVKSSPGLRVRPLPGPGPAQAGGLVGSGGCCTDGPGRELRPLGWAPRGPSRLLTKAVLFPAVGVAPGDRDGDGAELAGVRSICKHGRGQPR